MQLAWHSGQGTIQRVQKLRETDAFNDAELRNSYSRGLRIGGWAYCSRLWQRCRGRQPAQLRQQQLKQATLLVDQSFDCPPILHEGEYPIISGWRYERSPAVRSGRSDSELPLLWTDKNGLSIFQIGETDTKRVRLKFGPGISIDVDTNLRSVSDSSRQTLAPADAYHLLADQVYPRILSHQGAFIIHAGGVRVGNHAALFLGPSGYGKSTLVASFEQSGVSLMGDDAIWIALSDGVPMARALYPSLRLMPDSLTALFSPSVEIAPVAAYTIKQRVIRSVQSMDGSPVVPIAAIFLLSSTPANEIGIRRLSIASACMACVENSFALNPSDTEQAKRRLAQSTALARRVPAFEITYPRDYARLPDVRQAIIDQVASLELA